VASARAARFAGRALLLLGAAAQVLVLRELWPDLPVLLPRLGAEAALVFAPLLLTVAGTLPSKWLLQRGSPGWALLAAGVPALLLLLALGLAAWLAIDPPRLHHN